MIKATKVVGSVEVKKWKRQRFQVVLSLSAASLSLSDRVEVVERRLISDYLLRYLSFHANYCQLDSCVVVVVWWKASLCSPLAASCSPCYCSSAVAVDAIAEIACMHRLFLISPVARRRG